MSSHRLAVTDPLPSSVLSSAPSTMTGAPAASPTVDPPRDPAHPTHVPSSRRTASENGSVAAYGSPDSTSPAAPAIARPVTVSGPVEVGPVTSVVASVVASGLDAPVASVDPGAVADALDGDELPVVAATVTGGPASFGLASWFDEHAPRSASADITSTRRRSIGAVSHDPTGASTARRDRFLAQHG